MSAFITRRGILIAVGFILLALFIWFAGPLFAFGEWRPLESILGRVITITLVVLIWVGSQVVKRLRANRASDQLVNAVVQQSRTESRPSADAVQLRERFEDAVATLKQKRRSGHSLYDLPWYVIIGAPGSGKTTVLVNSGLNFPLEQRSGKGALRGVGGTRNCDWWFTDEAVFLDTAGRYTTQDSDADADSAGWTEFLKLLQKYRKRRPVNGVILTISAQDLMVQGHSSREAHVAAARRRLNELNAELKIQLPVYLLVTKCDLVAGFTEYFDDLEQDGRAQVWGVTFPYDVTTAGRAADAFQGEFDALMTRLNERVFVRLDEERDPRRRTKIFGFPQQMSALRDLLCGFVSDVFSSTRWDQQILLRGVYFTSGTQEGTPIDRLLGAIGRRFSVAPDAVSTGARGKAYFIERLLKDVLFAESGLAGVNRRLEFRKAAAQLGAYAAMALVAVLGVVLFTISYSGNRSYINAVTADVQAFEKVPARQADASLETLLPRLDAIKQVSDSANRFPDGAPWSMRWGLFQGNSLGNAARDAYSRELADALLPQVKARIEQRIASYAADPLKMYDYLRAYLMLGDPAHQVKSQLAYIADLEWKDAYQADPDLYASVSRHFQALLDNTDQLGPLTLNQDLVARARSTLGQVPVPQLAYQAIRLNNSQDSSLRLDVASGLGADRVFRRKSGARMDKPVPRIYTKEAFKEITDGDSAAIVKQVTDDYWVFGDAPKPNIVQQERLKNDVIAVYEKDYSENWRAIVNDIELVPTPSLPATTDALGTLASQNSPLRGFLKVVRDNTTLVDLTAKPAEASQGSKLIPSGLTNFLGAAKEKAGLNPDPPGTQVTKDFADIRRVVDGEAGAAPIDKVIGQIGNLQQQLSAVGNRLGQNVSAVQALGETGPTQSAQALQQDAKDMPPAVGAIVTQITGQTLAVAAREGGKELSGLYQQRVVAVCQQLVGGRYPFAANSMSDVTLVDFSRLFMSGGVFDQFFKEQLEQLVDTSRSPWTFKTTTTGSAIGVSPAMLRQFEMAQRIRDRFFAPGSSSPQVNFTIVPVDLDTSVNRFRLELDGQVFEYTHGPERPVQMRWPGQMPGLVAAFEDRVSGRPNVTFSGPWAWFRFLDNTRVQPESDVRFVVTFERGGYTAVVRIDAASVFNPFGQRELQQFRCQA